MNLMPLSHVIFDIKTFCASKNEMNIFLKILRQKSAEIATSLMIFQKNYCCYILTIVWGAIWSKKSRVITVNGHILSLFVILLHYQVLRGHPVHNSDFLKNCQDDDRPPYFFLVSTSCTFDFW